MCDFVYARCLVEAVEWELICAPIPVSTVVELFRFSNSSSSWLCDLFGYIISELGNLYLSLAFTFNLSWYSGLYLPCDSFWHSLYFD